MAHRTNPRRCTVATRYCVVNVFYLKIMGSVFGVLRLTKRRVCVATPCTVWRSSPEVHRDSPAFFGLSESSRIIIQLLGNPEQLPLTVRITAQHRSIHESRCTPMCFGTFSIGNAPPLNRGLHAICILVTPNTAATIAPVLDIAKCDRYPQPPVILKR